MKSNYHTHSIWCDGEDSPRRVVELAIAKGFSTIGFSSHSMLPETDTSWVLTPKKIPNYSADVRELAKEFAGYIKVLCGVEADYVRGGANPDRSTYAELNPDYIIGSVHFVVAPDGARVPVDHSPQLLEAGIKEHFDGKSSAFVRAYFEQEREMITQFDFDVIGHPDLVRKFNTKHPYFRDNTKWYRQELIKTADVIAASHKLVEVNTGAIARGWMDDVYPSAEFRDLLRERGVKFILSSDSHAAETIDCAFDRFGAAEDYVQL